VYKFNIIDARTVTATAVLPPGTPTGSIHRKFTTFRRNNQTNASLFTETEPESP
jgi:hypothetical protein